MTVRIAAESFPVIARRLAVDIHARAYHDAGVEVSPDGFRIGTPHCKKGDRTLGRLAFGGSAWSTPGRGYTSWAELRIQAFADLGVQTWRDREHKGCFHRRGKARYDLVFAVATELAAAQTRRSLGVATGTADEVAWLKAADDEIPAGRPPRHLVLSCCGHLLAMLRTDGRAVTSDGVVDLDDLWWRGLAAEDIAAVLSRRLDHPHH